MFFCSCSKLRVPRLRNVRRLLVYLAEEWGPIEEGEDRNEKAILKAVEVVDERADGDAGLVGAATSSSGSSFRSSRRLKWRD